ncbi:hypothetical protein BDV32DRAFT_135864 [Aspergillus pseudonomiae]|uniref:Uncharacterized protein n=1 Tax=Aspergillus pseudonomiae TaxID=1506151 RepID=A0A5N6IAB0_9EURO|nr:uncharacterized protein BDV37DRAFT_278991 [Aspergillus pseudonomiae]KAB8263641.1 hypothetical protein BDV32DRAFT_135864 [Aspergillus pseudonomiae]KAE8408505.1 hypothetical protein BDV37DRAFT_278991 [Aspergillus pseudonomiae]
MRIGVLKGNGIGPEISAATIRVIEATGIQPEWDFIPIAEEAVRLYGHPLPPQVIHRLKDVKLCIKAPLLAEKLHGRISCTQADGSVVTYPSINNAIRRELNLFVNPRRVRGYAGISERHEKMDLVIMREITEDTYIGWEQSLKGGAAAEAIKRVTRSASWKVSQYAFEYARKHGRKKVSCLHKANVLHETDGLFLRTFQEVARLYPDIMADDMMIDAACYAVVRDPYRFDVVVTVNQYGDIFSDLAAGLAGSLGLAPGANIGDCASTFEAAHGAAPDIQGTGAANPIALILSGAELLVHAGYVREAEAIQDAVTRVIEAGKILTPDLGGCSTTEQVADAISAEVRAVLQRS